MKQVFRHVVPFYHDALPHRTERPASRPPVSEFDEQSSYAIIYLLFTRE